MLKSQSAELVRAAPFLVMWMVVGFVELVNATFSIAATDRSSGHVGGAGASCVPNESIMSFLYHGVPGKGVLHTQAVPLNRSSDAVRFAIGEMNQLSPETILEGMNELDNATDPTTGVPVTLQNYLYRQNAVVDLSGRNAAWTGPGIDPLYLVLNINDTVQENTGGSVDQYTFSAQGNVVTNGTVTALKHGFVNGSMEESDAIQEGCDLADRLMKALETVSLMGEGDVRCLFAENEPLNLSGTPAAGAFLRVEAFDGTVVVDLEVVGSGEEDPTIPLKEMYETWRASNPCPAGDVNLSPTPSPTFASNAATIAAMGSGGLALLSLLFALRSFLCIAF